MGAGPGGRGGRQPGWRGGLELPWVSGLPRRVRGPDGSSASPLQKAKAVSKGHKHRCGSARFQPEPSCRFGSVGN